MHNFYLEVVYSRGRNMLNTKKANYSFGGLHRVFQIAFKAIQFEKMSPQNMLILGFGAGSVASIVQEEYGKKSVRITGVEIDSEIIELGKKYFNTERYVNTNIICSDAFTFIQQTKDKYDLIVVDIYNEVLVPQEFESVQFLKEIHSHLNINGCIIFNKVAHTDKFYFQFEELQKEMSKVYTRVNVVKALGMNRVLVAYK